MSRLRDREAQWHEGPSCFCTQHSIQGGSLADQEFRMSYFSHSLGNQLSVVRCIAETSEKILDGFTPVCGNSVVIIMTGCFLLYIDISSEKLQTLMKCRRERRTQITYGT
jgi:hypothetical protein